MARVEGRKRGKLRMGKRRRAKGGKRGWVMVEKGRKGRRVEGGKRERLRMGKGERAKDGEKKG